MTPQEETRVLMAMILCGAVLAVAYDVLWLLRKVCFPGRIALAICDVLFGILCGLGVIAAAFWLRADALRLYVLCGVLCGMMLQRISIGYILRRLMMTVKKEKKNGK